MKNFLNSSYESEERILKNEIRLLIFSVFLFTACAGFGQSVELTYLGNEGFLIESGTQSVLIDALFGSGLSGYPVVPQATRETIESAKEKFAEVDVVLASHHHPDHFEAHSLSRHLIHNPQARFFSTSQAVERLRALESWKQIQSRVQVVTPAEGKSLSYVYSGIRLISYNLHHGKDLPHPVENIAWLIRIGGKKLIHLGDTVISATEAAPLRLPDQKIDTRLVPFWFLMDSEMKRVLDQIPANHTVLMHIPEPAAPEDYFGNAKNHKNLLAILQQHITKEDWVPLQTNERRVFSNQQLNP
jgi:L-ascorbate metabolism protein UlaG (beta-lactamase superfamily)